jgi:hypothetical protein
MSAPRPPAPPCRHREPTGCTRCERAAIIWASLVDEHACAPDCSTRVGQVCLCAQEADRLAAKGAA